MDYYVDMFNKRIRPPHCGRPADCRSRRSPEGACKALVGWRCRVECY